MDSMQSWGRRDYLSGTWASPIHPAYLGFVFHGHRQLHPLLQAESTSEVQEVLHLLILQHLIGCSRSKGAPYPVLADHPLPLQNEVLCPQAMWAVLGRSWGLGSLRGSPGRIPALALPGMPTEELTTQGIRMPVALGYPGPGATQGPKMPQ